MKAIGDRLNEFDNSPTQNVQTFNVIFPEVPLLFCSDNDTVVIGNITANATTRELLINNVAIEHSFLRRTNSENDYTNFDGNTINASDFDGVYDFI